MNLVPRKSLFGMDSFFDDHFPSFRLLPDNPDLTQIAVDINETEKGYVLKADFPGMNKDDIDVAVDNDVLTLSAEHKEQKEHKEKGKVIRQERRYGSVSRSFQLGKHIDSSQIKASFENGVLTVELPKVSDHVQDSRKIDIG